MQWPTPDRVSSSVFDRYLGGNWRSYGLFAQISNLLSGLGLETVNSVECSDLRVFFFWVLDWYVGVSCSNLIFSLAFRNWVVPDPWISVAEGEFEQIRREQKDFRVLKRINDRYMSFLLRFSGSPCVFFSGSWVQSLHSVINCELGWEPWCSGRMQWYLRFWCWIDGGRCVWIRFAMGGFWVDYVQVWWTILIF